MVRHWNGRIALAKTPQERHSMQWSRLVNMAGLALTAVTLVVVVVAKFTHGAWVTLLLVGCLVGVMALVRRHYARVDREVSIPADYAQVRSLPARVHAVVLLSALNRSSERALAYARAARHSTLEALTVQIDKAQVAHLRRDWDRFGVPVTLRILDAPSREITRPIIEYIRSLLRQAPRDLVVVYIPEKVVRHWWERMLHNRSAARLTTKLRHLKGVVVASIPWQLDSSTSGPAE
jgi:hypothetical protein